MTETPDPKNYVAEIRKRGLTIYDPIEIGDTDLWIPAPALETLLNKALKGKAYPGLAIRTRSKRINEAICDALGYPVPASFKKTKPRFQGQRFDKYAQQANNLQVWNEQLEPTRRYVIIRISEDDVIVKVKVVTGDRLSLLDTTGTLTQKYQARLVRKKKTTELISAVDTEMVLPATNKKAVLREISPTANPQHGSLLPIATLFVRLESLIDKTFADAGHNQERRRGADLHALVCKRLGYARYADDGQFPDVRHQILEVKLQTAATIDLGLVCPNSKAPLDIPKLDGKQIRHCDVRYALFYATIKNGTVTITHLFLTTGEDFFSRFPQFGGKVLNKKLQIPLPNDFFKDADAESNGDQGI
jgi:hypothetical protein